MYLCHNCNHEFMTPEKERTTFEDYYGVNNLFPDKHDFNLLKCPMCKSEDIEEMKQCDVCGEYNLEENLKDTEGAINGGIGYLCPQCIEDYEIR